MKSKILYSVCLEVSKKLHHRMLLTSICVLQGHEQASCVVARFSLRLHGGAQPHCQSAPTGCSRSQDTSVRATLKRGGCSGGGTVISRAATIYAHRSLDGQGEQVSPERAYRIGISGWLVYETV